MNIYLIGYRCTGKTTIGKLLSHDLDMSFVDTDKKIESKIGTSISQFVSEHGWSEFRKIEKIVLFKSNGYKNSVISTGGGIILDPENQSFIKNHGFCCWLTADLYTILNRIKNDKHSATQRPSLTANDIESETTQLLKKRDPIYKNTAHLKIDTSLLIPKEIVNLIKRNLTDVR